MPTFDTPQPISVSVELTSGRAHIVASDRTDTVVEVRPRDESDPNDVQAVEQVRIAFGNGRLVVKSQKKVGSFGRRGSLDIGVEVPSGSAVAGQGGAASFRCDGRLGECRFWIATGDVELGIITGLLTAEVGRGNVSSGRVEGRAEITVGLGTVRLAEVTAAAVVKSAGGDNWIGSVGGELRVNGSRGAITVGRAEGAAQIKTAHGTIRVGRVDGDSAVLETGVGDVDFGVPAGTAVRLDAATRLGRVRNLLAPAEGPMAGATTKLIRARAMRGDIVIRRG